jgi:hypothetical protein
MTNYKPTLILGSTYKIASKTLDNRLWSFLALWMWPTQTGFVQGKFIQNNVFLTFEVMEWANENDQDLVMFFFDFEKA